MVYAILPACSNTMGHIEVQAIPEEVQYVETSPLRIDLRDPRVLPVISNPHHGFSKETVATMPLRELLERGIRTSRVMEIPLIFFLPRNKHYAVSHA